jgi:hypothetical protein
MRYLKNEIQQYIKYKSKIVRRGKTLIDTQISDALHVRTTLYWHDELKENNVQYLQKCYFFAQYLHFTKRNFKILNVHKA